MDKLRNLQTLKRQKEYIKELLRLVKDNPDLPIIPRVDTEVVASDEYTWWAGAFGRAHIEEVITKPDGSITRRRDEDDDTHYDVFFGNDDDYNLDATDKEMKAKVDSLPWMRCIVVDIGTPEFDIPEQERAEKRMEQEGS